MKIVFVGPDPSSPHIAHAGGQLTAAQGFAQFAANQGIRIEWVDTAQSNFPVPPARQRFVRAGKRLARFARLIAAPTVDGAILFSGAGVSFVERSLMALAARIFRKPAVLMVRSGHFRTQYEKSPWFRGVARVLLRLPRRIGVQGESWVPLLHSAGVTGDRIVVVPNWLSHPPADPRARVFTADAPLRLLFAGWMTAAKGVPELIEAAGILAAAKRNFTLTLVGGGTLLENAREAARQSALSDRLVVTGWLGRSELAAELQRTDILVLPSHAEGFPNIVMEALAEGVPVIATPVGAIPDSVTDGINGTIVPLGSAAAIARAVEFYLDNPETIERHSRAALAVAASRHDRDSNCRALIAALA